MISIDRTLVRLRLSAGLSFELDIRRIIAKVILLNRKYFFIKLWKAASIRAEEFVHNRFNSTVDVGRTGTPAPGRMQRTPPRKRACQHVEESVRTQPRQISPAEQPRALVQRQKTGS